MKLVTIIYSLLLSCLSAYSGIAETNYEGKSYWVSLNGNISIGIKSPDGKKVPLIKSISLTGNHKNWSWAFKTDKAEVTAIPGNGKEKKFRLNWKFSGPRAEHVKATSFLTLIPSAIDLTTDLDFQGNIKDIKYSRCIFAHGAKWTESFKAGKAGMQFKIDPRRGVFNNAKANYSVIGLPWKQEGDSAKCTLKITWKPYWGSELMTQPNKQLKPIYGYKAETYIDKKSKITLPYRLFVPKKYNKSQKYPLVVFLHGGGRLGSDNIGQVKGNAGAMCWVTPEVQRKHPSFVVAPQASKKLHGWVQAPFKEEAYDLSKIKPSSAIPAVFRLLDELRKEYNIDPDRIYFTGQSLGGIGTWYVAMVHHDRIAAAAPVCGTSDPRQAVKMGNLPVWAFHGAKDSTIPVNGSRNMIKALKAAGNPNVKYSEYPDCKHDAWNHAYKDDMDKDGEVDLVTWMFSQHRSGSKPESAKTKNTISYDGKTYSLSVDDNLRIDIKGPDGQRKWLLNGLEISGCDAKWKAGFKTTGVTSSSINGKGQAKKIQLDWNFSGPLADKVKGTSILTLYPLGISIATTLHFRGNVKAAIPRSRCIISQAAWDDSFKAGNAGMYCTTTPAIRIFRNASNKYSVFSLPWKQDKQTAECKFEITWIPYWETAPVIPENLSGASLPEIFKAAATATLADCGYYLEAMDMWGEKYSQPELKKELVKLKKQSPENLQTALALWKKIKSTQQEQRNSLYADARNTNKKMTYRVGLARDYSPIPMLDEWTLFRMNAFRLGVSEHFLGKGTTEELLNRAGQALEEGDKTGAVGVVSYAGITRGKEGLQAPVDFCFNNNFIPMVKPCINSALIREHVNSILIKYTKFFSRYPAFQTLKIGNEPFWCLGPAIAIGFGQATIGCPAAVYQEHVRREYHQFSQWHKALDAYDKESSRGRGAYRKSKIIREGNIGKWFKWKSFADMSIPKNEMSGLTFIDYLKRKYSSLEALNSVWFGGNKNKWFASWDNVFPPRPVISRPVGLAEILADQVTDIPAFMIDKSKKETARAPKGLAAAWADWLSFQPCSTAEYLDSAKKVVRDKVGGPRYITTNAITGHYINNFNNIAAVSGLNPWDTQSGMDTMAIDFYSISYLQGYIRSLAGAAHGRPIQIHEAGGASGKNHKGVGANPANTAYMVLYSFAYGTDMLLFWRRDAKLEPVLEIEIAKAMKALDNDDLQHNSVPVTDGVAVIYSQDSLFLAQGMDGTARRMILPFQAALQLSKRLHLLYDLYSNRQLEKQGIPADIRVLMLPGAFAVSGKLLKQLETFVKRGGRIVVGSSFALYDERARTRTRPAWLNGANVLTIPEQDWLTWNNNFLNDHNITANGVKTPEWINTVDRFITPLAPRSVRYLDSRGQSADQCISGARKSEKAMYAFINPGVTDITVQAKGIYKKAINLYTGKDMVIKKSGKFTEVKITRGPAVISFIR